MTIFPIRAFLLLVAASMLGGCGSSDPAGPGEAPDRAEKTVDPSESASLSLQNGASVNVQPGTFGASVRLVLEETQDQPSGGEVGPTVRLRISAIAVNNSNGSTRLVASAEQPIRLCVPSTNTSLSSVDVLVRSGGVSGYAWAGRTIGSCIELDLPPGLYEAEFVAILVDRAAGSSCDQFGLVPDARNQPTRNKALVLIHGLQLDRPTCASFEAFNPTADYWQGFLGGVIDCSACQNVRNEYNIYYFRYPTIVSPELSAARLRVELNRLAASGDPLSSSTELVLVGYSMGGLVGRYFLRVNRVNQFSRIQKLITLGTPHLGTYDILANPGLLYRAGLKVIKSPFPDTEGTRILSWKSAFIRQLNDGDLGNRRDIYTYAGRVQSVNEVFHPELWISFGVIREHITDDEMTVLGEGNDAIVPVNSAALLGSVRVGTLAGYDHYDLRDGKQGPNDPIWVSIRALLGELALVTTEVRGTLLKRGVPVVGWPVYLIAEPDTFYFFDRIAELPISTTTTRSDGSFVFTGLEINRNFAFLSINPRSDGFVSDEMRYILLENVPLEPEREILVPAFDINYDNIVQVDNTLRIDFNQANPNPIVFSWPSYNRVVAPKYGIHVHFRDSEAPCWFSPITSNTSTSFFLVCNSDRHNGQRAGPGKYYWYVKVYHPNESSGLLSGYSYPEFFTLADIRGGLAPLRIDGESPDVPAIMPGIGKQPSRN